MTSIQPSPLPPTTASEPPDPFDGLPTSLMLREAAGDDVHRSTPGSKELADRLFGRWLPTAKPAVEIGPEPRATE